MVHISLSGEVLFHLGSLPVTNTLLTTWLVMLFIIVSSVLILSTYKLMPTKSQIVVESLVYGLYSMFESILGKSTSKFYPLLATLFIFIMFCNWSGLLPGVGTIGIKKSEQTLTHAYAPIAYAASETRQEPQTENNNPKTKATTHTQEDSSAKRSERPFDIPLFRAPTADLNTTLALSLIAMAMMQFWGMQMLGSLTYIGKFITFSSPINFFVGILELLSEFGKIISFAFRLFGNIFAGEVLLVIIAALIPLIAPIPFLGLEIFVGVIQALVFAMLLAVFLSLATTKAQH